VRITTPRGREGVQQGSLVPDCTVCICAACWEDVSYLHDIKVVTLAAEKRPRS